MATQKQIEANRRNAQQSTGPKTEAGRQIVGRNAVTHGLTAARNVVLPGEEEEFDRFAEAMHYEWNLQGATERITWERMLHCAWRLKRITRIETSVLLAMCQKENGPEPSDKQTLGRAYAQVFPVLNTLARHERQLENSLRLAHRELELLQYARETQTHPFCPEPAEASPSGGCPDPPCPRARAFPPPITILNSHEESLTPENENAGLSWSRPRGVSNRRTGQGRTGYWCSIPHSKLAPLT